MAAKTNVPAEQAEQDYSRHPVLQEADVKQAAKAWRTLKENAVRDLKHWWNVGNGLLTVYNRLEADKGGKAPSRKEFGQAIEAAGLGDIPQPTRSAAMKLHEEFEGVEEAQKFLKQIGSGAAHPEAVKKAIANYRKQAEQPGAEGSQDRDPGDTVEDAEYSDTEPGDGGPAPVDAEVQDDEEAPTPSNREAQRTSGSDPWWMKQANQIADLPDLVTEIDPYGLASACKDVTPIEEKLTADRRQRVRERAEQILAFLDAFEDDDQDEAA
jgi:hypothetical protein